MSNHHFSKKLEREFEMAKDQGRWLREDEQKGLDHGKETSAQVSVIMGGGWRLAVVWQLGVGCTC